MKNVTFTLELGFSDKVSSDQLQEIARKVVDALKHECDAGNGLAPEESNAFTTNIKVSHETPKFSEGSMLD